MPITDFSLSFEAVEQAEDDKIPVIIVAAGSSSRMGGLDKQLLDILGIPVLARTLLAFESCCLISKIIIVTRAESLLTVQRLCDKYEISKLSDIVIGGKNRHESVMAGIERLSDEDKKVLIHDGARPLVDGNVIGGVVNALHTYDAAACTVGVTDTVKLTDNGKTVLRTVDRSAVRLAQTPQGVDVAKFKEAALKQNGDSFTDDASLMESAGYSVAITEGSVENIKITTAEDVLLAEFYISRERK